MTKPQPRPPFTHPLAVPVEDWNWEGGKDCDIYFAIYERWLADLRGPPGKARRIAEAQLEIADLEDWRLIELLVWLEQVGAPADEVIEELRKAKGERL